MKLHLELNMGAAGDMLMAALYELLPHPQAFTDKMRRLDLPGITIDAEKTEKCGIRGTHMRVRVRGVDEVSHDIEPHSHSIERHGAAHTHAPAAPHLQVDESLSYHKIMDTIATLNISERAKRDARAVYELLADAESEVHNTPMEHLHFHEVGTLDALADIVGVCMLIDLLGIEEITASPVHVGSGNVKCAHGILPVPTPATALLLRGIPTYGGRIKGELCTPTGAALLRHFVTRFGDTPTMRVKKIGYGMGTKDFDAANCVRAFLYGDAPDEQADEVVEMRCNLDDMTAEAIGFACEQLLADGALDVFTSAIQMKKSRPAALLTVLCKPADEERLTRAIFRHTTTLGVRKTTQRRAILSRKTEERATRYGKVRVKIANGYGVRREKPEFDDIARLARENNVPLHEVTLGK